MKPEDELIDALLKEQARKRDADESLLTSIGDALDSEGAPRSQAPTWKRVVPLSVAAALAMGGVAIYHSHQKKSPELAIHTDSVREYERPTTGVPAGLESHEYLERRAHGESNSLPKTSVALAGDLAEEASDLAANAGRQVPGAVAREEAGAFTQPRENTPADPAAPVVGRGVARALPLEESPVAGEPSGLGNEGGRSTLAKKDKAMEAPETSGILGSSTDAPVPVPDAEPAAPLMVENEAALREAEESDDIGFGAKTLKIEGQLRTRDEVIRREVSPAPPVAKPMAVDGAVAPSEETLERKKLEIRVVGR